MRRQTFTLQVVKKHEDTMFRAELTAERERQALAERINSGMFAAEDRRFGRIKSVQAQAAAISGRQQVPLLGSEESSGQTWTLLELLVECMLMCSLHSMVTIKR